MTTVSAAHAAIKARIEANAPARVAGAGQLRWQNDDGVELPDKPAAYLYTELDPDRQYLAGFGGGTGANLWRTPARIDCYAFVPSGEGLASATDLAEEIAVLFRGYRDGNLQCFGASVYPLGNGAQVKPTGLSYEGDNYYVAVCEVDMHFDLTG